MKFNDMMQKLKNVVENVRKPDENKSVVKFFDNYINNRQEKCEAIRNEVRSIFSKASQIVHAMGESNGRYEMVQALGPFNCPTSENPGIYKECIERNRENKRAETSASDTVNDLEHIRDRGSIADIDDISSDPSDKSLMLPY